MYRCYCLFIGFIISLSSVFSLNMPAYQFLRQQALMGNETEVIPAIEHEIKKDKREAEWYLLLNEIYRNQGKFSERIALLEKAHSIKKMSNPMVILQQLAQTYFEAGHYTRARELFSQLPPTRGNQLSLQNCLIADSLKKHPNTYSREPFSTAINTPYDNLWPSTTIDQKWFCTTVVEGKNSPKGIPEMWNENIYIASKKDGEWQPTQVVQNNINTEQNEGATCFSADGNYMFFVRCQDQIGYGSCDIYYVIRQGDQWSQPINAGAQVNSKYWESTPNLSPDGKTLYFSSNRPGGEGGQDIWKCSVQQAPNKKLSFGPAENGGTSINTPWNEVAPFASANGQELYFSSNGWPGMGGLDIFKLLLDSTGHAPENMGYPLNTYQDELGFRLHIDGRTAYLSGPKDNTGSERIIYEIQLPADKQSQPMVCLQGQVTDAHSHQSLGASIQIYDARSQKPLFTTQSDGRDGSFSVLLLPDQWVELSAEKEGYAFSSELINAQDSSLHIALVPLQVGAKFNLHHIYFGFNQTTPLPTSQKELQQLVQLMQTHPQLSFTLIGHTDNIGNASYNQELSLQRAKAVAHYCQEQGIEAQRIQCMGKGSSEPSYSNATDLGRQRNRRIEVILTQSKEK